MHRLCLSRLLGDRLLVHEECAQCGTGVLVDRYNWMRHPEEGTTMKCPVCDETLREVQKHNVNVDICPGCKGVWLDRGELEKIVELAANGGQGSEMRSDQAGFRPSSEESHKPSRDHDDHDDHGKSGHDGHGGEQGYGHKKKKGSWLGDILGGIGGD
jgi:Zn-finger nucleic acid-binding protein